MQLPNIDEIIETSVFQELNKVIHLFPEIEEELLSICTNLKQRFVDNGYDTILDFCADLELTINRRDNTISDLEDELEDLRNRISDYERENNNLSDEVSNLEDEIKNLEYELQDLKR